LKGVWLHHNETGKRRVNIPNKEKTRQDHEDDHELKDKGHRRLVPIQEDQSEHHRPKAKDENDPDCWVKIAFHRGCTGLALPAGFRKTIINSLDLIRIGAEFRKFGQDVIEMTTGCLAHGVLFHLRPFFFEHRFDIVFQSLAEGIGIWQISGGVVGAYDRVSFTVDIGLGSEERRPQGDDGKADEKGVEGSEETKNRGVNIFLVFQALPEPPANQQQPSGNQRTGDQDQEKYEYECIHFNPRLCGRLGHRSQKLVRIPDPV